MKRSDYMSGNVTHQAYYSHIAKLAGIKPAAALVKTCRELLADGDEHLNKIPLAQWDLLAGGAWNQIVGACQRVEGEHMCLSTGVCTYKAAVRAAIEGK